MTQSWSLVDGSTHSNTPVPFIEISQSDDLVMKTIIQEMADGYEVSGIYTIADPSMVKLEGDMNSKSNSFLMLSFIPCGWLEPNPECFLESEIKDWLGSKIFTIQGIENYIDWSSVNSAEETLQKALSVLNYYKIDIDEA